MIVSDTHGRHSALDEALEQAGKIDMLLHLGDVEGGEDYIEAVAGCPVCMAVSYTHLSYERVDEDYNYTKSSEEGKKKHGNIHVFDFSSKWKIVLLIVAIVAILFVVFSIVSGIISMLMPFLGPLLLIIIVVKIFSNRKR